MSTHKQILNNLLTIMKQKGYRVASRPYELNLVALRNANPTSGVFDDELFVFYREEDTTWRLRVMKMTTDPGTYWLKTPMVPAGTAMMAQGQYPNLYTIGTHRGQYEALVQQHPVDYWRLRHNGTGFDIVARERGNIKLNLHRPSASAGPGKAINKDSAGCQVLASVADDALIRSLAKKHLLRYPEGITYTLIDFRAYDKAEMENLIKLIVGGVLIIWLLTVIAGKVIAPKKTKSNILNSLTGLDPLMVIKSHLKNHADLPYPGQSNRHAVSNHSTW